MICHIKIKLEKPAAIATPAKQIPAPMKAPNFSGPIKVTDYSGPVKVTDYWAPVSKPVTGAVPGEKLFKNVNAAATNGDKTTGFTRAPIIAAQNMQPTVRIERTQISRKKEKSVVETEDKIADEEVQEEPIDDPISEEEMGEPIKEEIDDDDYDDETEEEDVQPVGKYKCKKCKKTFRTERECSFHRNGCGKDRNETDGMYSVQCTVCKVRFGCIVKLRHHLKTVHKPERKDKEKKPLVPKYKCDKCCTRYLRQDQFNQHVCETINKIEGGGGQKENQCKICGRQYTCEEDLKEHCIRGERIIMSTKFQCKECGKHCIGWSRLNLHMKLSHTATEAFVCDTCGMSLKTQIGLNQHMTDEHNHPAPYECSVCLKGYWRKHKLDVHQLMHTGEKPHQCEICGKSFAERSNLKKHRRLHTTERAYACKLCDKRYKGPTYLKEHIDKVHDRSKDVQCTTCYKIFRSKDLLKKHNEIHLNLRRYKCDLCGTAYNNAGSLYAHKKKHKQLM